MNTYLRKYVVWLACLFLAACGSGDDDQAGKAGIRVLQQTAGVTPFISTLTLKLEAYADLTHVAFTISPKPGTFSRPVAVTLEKGWLDRKAAYNADEEQLALPIFGLYAGHRNDVTVTASFSDGSIHVERVAIETGAYSGPAAVYDSPDIKMARGPTSAPGVDYVMINNQLTTPVVIDTDGNMRWVATALSESLSSLFVGDAFYVGSATTPTLARLELNGAAASVPLSSPKFTNFHHEIAPGKSGLLVELDAVENGVAKIEAILAEIAADGQVLKEWDMAAIFRRTMVAGGDDPANFVRDGVDWFHMNSAIYNPSDNSLLVSSRENFVVKLDYDTGDIRWLLGDPSKHWYVNYPSLRSLALRLTAGKAPIGQHTLSLLPSGELLLFNNGFASLNQPAGTPSGENRTSSAPSLYAIDEQARTAAEVWTYEHMPPLNSEVCSSVVAPTPGNYLIAYAVASGRTRAKLIGVDSAGQVSFDFEYPTTPCATMFDARPVAFEALLLK